MINMIDIDFEDKCLIENNLMFLSELIQIDINTVKQLLEIETKWVEETPLLDGVGIPGEGCYQGAFLENYLMLNGMIPDEMELKSLHKSDSDKHDPDTLLDIQHMIDLLSIIKQA